MSVCVVMRPCRVQGGLVGWAGRCGCLGQDNEWMWEWEANRLVEDCAWTCETWIPQDNKRRVDKDEWKILGQT